MPNLKLLLRAPKFIEPALAIGANIWCSMEPNFPKV